MQLGSIEQVLRGERDAALPVGDARAVLSQMPANSVATVCTSPPYHQVRTNSVPPLEFGIQAGCSHEWVPNAVAGITGGIRSAKVRIKGTDNFQHVPSTEYEICPRCGGYRGELGREPTVKLYVAHLMEILESVRRVLHPTGTLWLNLGDSYAGSGKGPTGHNGIGNQAQRQGFIGTGPRYDDPDYKPKDMQLVPYRVVRALQKAGWYVRSVAPWIKPNCLSGNTFIYAQIDGRCQVIPVRKLAQSNASKVRLWNGERWTQMVSIWPVEPETDAMEVVLRSGQYIGCTAEHRWPTRRGLLTAAELVVGDVLQAAKLPEQDFAKYPSGLDDEDIGWFVGLYIAEGHRDNLDIRLSCHADEVEKWKPRLQSLAAAYHGTYRSSYQHGKQATIAISSVILSAVLDKYVYGKGALEKHLTNACWERSDRFLRAVLDGYLEGDGHFDETNRRWRLGFADNRALAVDLRTLCARLGVSLRLHTARMVCNGKEYPGWRGQIRFDQEDRSVNSGSFAMRPDNEVVSIRYLERHRKFWDVAVADEPHLFALASGVLTHNSMPHSVRDRPNMTNEWVFQLSKERLYYYDPDAVLRRGATQPWRNWRTTDSWNDSLDDEIAFLESYLEYLHELRRGEGVLMNGAGRITAFIARPGRSQLAHFSIFPPKLVEPMIRATAPDQVCAECWMPWIEGERRCGHVRTDSVSSLVLDPFAGTSTTGRVALALGRRYVGVDLNDSYVAMAQENLKEPLVLA